MASVLLGVELRLLFKNKMLCVWVLCLYVCLWTTCMPSAICMSVYRMHVVPSETRRGVGWSDHMELETQTVLNRHVDVGN